MVASDGKGGHGKGDGSNKLVIRGGSSNQDGSGGEVVIGGGRGEMKATELMVITIGWRGTGDKGNQDGDSEGGSIDGGSGKGSSSRNGGYSGVVKESDSINCTSSSEGSGSGVEYGKANNRELRWHWMR
ncbi:hypothetical protein Ancab_016426 [Ancistrocladus abbreviatus]